MWRSERADIASQGKREHSSSPRAHSYWSKSFAGSCTSLWFPTSNPRDQFIAHWECILGPSSSQEQNIFISFQLCLPLQSFLIVMWRVFFFKIVLKQIISNWNFIILSFSFWLLFKFENRKAVRCNNLLQIVHRKKSHIHTNVLLCLSSLSRTQNNAWCWLWWLWTVLTSLRCVNNLYWSFLFFSFFQTQTEFSLYKRESGRILIICLFFIVSEPGSHLLSQVL